MEKFLTAETSRAVGSCLISVNEQVGKFLGLQWVQKQNLTSVRISDLWLFSCSQKMSVSLFFFSFFRLPLGPTLINLHLSSVTCLHFFLWFRWYTCYSSDDLEVKESVQEAEIRENVLLLPQNCHIRPAQFLIFMTAMQGLEPERHANKSDWNPVQKVTQSQLIVFLAFAVEDVTRTGVNFKQNTAECSRKEKQAFELNLMAVRIRHEARFTQRTGKSYWHITIKIITVDKKNPIGMKAWPPIQGVPPPLTPWQLG